MNGRKALATHKTLSVDTAPKYATLAFSEHTKNHNDPQEKNKESTRGFMYAAWRSSLPYFIYGEISLPPNLGRTSLLLSSPKKKSELWCQWCLASRLSAYYFGYHGCLWHKLLPKCKKSNLLWVIGTLESRWVSIILRQCCPECAGEQGHRNTPTTASAAPQFRNYLVLTWERLWP